MRNQPDWNGMCLLTDGEKGMDKQVFFRYKLTSDAQTALSIHRYDVTCKLALRTFTLR